MERRRKGRKEGAGEECQRKLVNVNVNLYSDIAHKRHGSVRRTVPSGENSWRRLCPAKDAPPDDDDDKRKTSNALKGTRFHTGLPVLLFPTSSLARHKSENYSNTDAPAFPADDAATAACSIQRD